MNHEAALKIYDLLMQLINHSDSQGHGGVITVVGGDPNRCTPDSVFCMIKRQNTTCFIYYDTNSNSRLIGDSAAIFFRCKLLFFYPQFQVYFNDFDKDIEEPFDPYSAHRSDFFRHKGRAQLIYNGAVIPGAIEWTDFLEHDDA